MLICSYKIINFHNEWKLNAYDCVKFSVILRTNGGECNVYTASEKNTINSAAS